LFIILNILLELWKITINNINNLLNVLIKTTLSLKYIFRNIFKSKKSIK